MPILYLSLFALISFLGALIILPTIIRYAHRKSLYDEPTDKRKVHSIRTPNLGGVSIFVASIATYLIFGGSTMSLMEMCLIVGALIIFLLGLVDDLIGLTPSKKIAVQLCVSIFLVLVADLRISNLHGLFGFTKLGYPLSIAISVIFIVLITNAFNLIDGIDWLAGSLGLIACLVFAGCFHLIGNISMVMFSLAIAGSLIAFLIFNRTPARIFLGDSGSLFLGFVISVFAIRISEAEQGIIGQLNFLSRNLIYIVSGILIVPVFDTCRLFLLRTIKGNSPFKADRQHLHHKLLDLGFSHLKSTLFIVLLTLLSIVTSIVLSFMKLEFVLVTLFAYSAIFHAVLTSLLHRKLSRATARQRIGLIPIAGKRDPFKVKPLFPGFGSAIGSNRSPKRNKKRLA